MPTLPMQVRLIRGVLFLLLLVALAACRRSTSHAPRDLTGKWSRER